MASLLECSLRAYSDNENGTPRTIYVLAAELLAMSVAWEHGDPALLPEDLRAEYGRLQGRAGFQATMADCVARRRRPRVSAVTSGG